MKLTCKCVYLSVYMLSHFRDQSATSDLELKNKKGSVLCLNTPVSLSVEDISATRGHPFLRM